MTKLISLLILAVAISSFIACSDTQTASQSNAQNNQTRDESFTSDGAPSGAMTANQNTIIGLVTDVVGNDITLQIGTMVGGAQSGMGAGAQNSTDDNAQNGTQPSAQNEAGTSSDEGAQGNRPNTGDTQEGATNAEGRPSDAQTNGGSQPSGEGAQSGMAGGIGQGNMAEQDYAELVTLTDETKTYSIPVTTPVTQFNTELTFSSIAVDTYISIATDDEGNILSVNVLG